MRLYVTIIINFSRHFLYFYVNKKIKCNLAIYKNDKDDVIKTYHASFSLYKYLLSIDERIDDHKNLNAIIRKEYSINNKRTSYNSIKKLNLSKKYLSK